MTDTTVSSAGEGLLGGSGRPRMSPGQRLLTHLEVGRPDLCFYAGLVSVAGAVLASPNWTAWQLVGAWLAPICGWFAAMYGGDYFDRELDGITKSQRPLPSGRMRPREALAGMIAWVVVGAVVAAVLNPLSLIMVGLALAIGVAYSKVLKAHGIWGNIGRGAITTCAFFVGALSTSDEIPWGLLIPVGVVFGLHDAASNVVGAICDADGDRQGGYRTFPVRHGEKSALALMVVLHLAWIAIAAGYPSLWSADRFELAAYLPLLVIAIVLTGISVAMLLRSAKPVPRMTGLKSHEVLVVERLVLAGSFVAGAAGIWLGLGILVPFVAGTYLASLFLMRGSYEPSRRWQAIREARRSAGQRS